MPHFKTGVLGIGSLAIDSRAVNISDSLPSNADQTQ